MDNTENKELFLSTFRKNVQRPGAEKLLAWMETTDFFTAPASTRFHAAYEGGLLDHSMNVYNVLISKHFDPASDDIESFTIVSLLHDLCKAGFYKTELRNRKNDRGEWEKVPVYTFGENSFAVRSVPAYLDSSDVQSVISELAEKAMNSRTTVPDRLDDLIHTVACKAAIKAGQATTMLELQSLCDRVLSDDNVRSCPHGRPTTVRLTKYELDKMFKRVNQ